jgi:GT2 family glycosyltransferase
VIPTFRRNDRLRRTLAALESQDAPVDSFEVIVVADAVEDDAGAVRDAVDAPARPYAVRTLDRHAPGVGAARNRGWLEARSALVLFLGDDILADRDLLSQHLAWHERHPDQRVGVLGYIRWARELTVSPFMHWLEHGLQFNYPSIDGIDAGFGHFYTANISLKRAMLERVGGFDEERFPFLYEDIDLGYRLYESGFRLLYNRRANAQHLHPSRPEEWSGRMAATAAAERKWVQLHPELEPYFHDKLAHAASLTPLRGRAARLLPWTPRWVPWLGRRVWENSTTYFHQQLAPAFLEAWQRGERAA